MRSIGSITTPIPSCTELRGAVAARLGVPPSHLFFANGVDNVLTCLGLAFLDAGDQVVIGAPTYTAYAALALLLDAIPIEVPLAGWRFDVEAMADASDGAKAVIVCNPNNPTGSIITHAEAETLLARVSDDTLVVMDEAYGEWADDPAFPDAVALVRRHRNLIVLRTFSKIYGLAGLRVGYAIADPELIASMNQVREPFAVDRLAQAGALAVLEDDAYRHAAFENNRTGKAFLARAFTEMGLEHLPTQANFILRESGAARRRCRDASPAARRHHPARPPLAAADLGAHHDRHARRERPVRRRPVRGPPGRLTRARPDRTARRPAGGGHRCTPLSQRPRRIYAVQSFLSPTCKPNIELNDMRAYRPAKYARSWCAGRGTLQLLFKSGTRAPIRGHAGHGTKRRLL